MVVRFSAALAALASSVLAFGCDDDNDEVVVVPGELPATVTFRVTTLVTNSTDAELINPWGIVSSEGVFWIADNVTGNISILDQTGAQATEYPRDRFVIGEGITGIAKVQEDGDTTSFVISTGGRCCPQPAADGSRSGTPRCRSAEETTTTCPTSQAEFVVARMNGTLIALNDEAPTSGVVVIDQSSAGAAYFGVTRIDSANGPELLVANFAAGRIDVFDAQFRPISLGTAAAFSDPELPAGFSPWNVMAFGDRVFVEYAQVSSEAPPPGEPPEEQPGPGLGHVTVFDTNGAVIARLDNTLLNAPWGVAVREPDTTLTCDDEDVLCQGAARGAIYIGNFGDGTIATFDPVTYEPLGQLTDTDGNLLVLDGLWGLTFSDQPAAESTSSLFFVAGPAEETAGEFGRLDPVVTTQPGGVVVVDEDDNDDIDDLP